MSKVEYIAYPPTSFPLRDLLVLEHFPIGLDDHLCEIGVGSGATAARFARRCAHVTGFEISASTVDLLRYLEVRHLNLDLVVADAVNTDSLERYQHRFTRLLSCDTLEHVTDPGAFFRTVARLLRPGGRFFVTFPNEPQALMHGVTRFDTPAELAEHLCAAGLREHRIGSARLRPQAAWLIQSLGWKPLQLLHQLRARVARASATPAARSSTRLAAGSNPQVFDETDFFRRYHLWRRLAPAVNLYWHGLMRVVELGGDAFEMDWEFRRKPFVCTQIVVTGSA